MCEIDQRRGLAIARWSRDKRQPTFKSLLNLLAHLVTVQKTSRAGHQEFGADERSAKISQRLKDSQELTIPRSRPLNKVYCTTLRRQAFTCRLPHQIAWMAHVLYDAPIVLTQAFASRERRAG